jgi:hypothetical protein
VTGQPYAFTGDDPLNATDPLGQADWSDFFSALIALVANLHFTFGVPKHASDDLPDTKPEPIEKPAHKTETQQPKDPDKMKGSEPNNSRNSSNSRNSDTDGSRGNSSNSTPQPDPTTPSDS